MQKLIFLGIIWESKSSNVNEVIRAVLNFFFYEKILHTLKALEALKALKALKELKDTKTQPRKSTKRK